MAMNTIEAAFLHELEDALSAEKQLAQALPQMAKAASHDELRQAFEQHLEQTKHHVELVEQAFSACGRKPSAHKCEAMEGIIAEGKETLSEDGAADVKDAMLIAGAQKAEHYEISLYGTLCTWAEMLHNEEALQALQTILSEEKETDAKLNKLAKQRVNEDAMRES